MKKLKALRTRRKLSLRGLAARAGVHYWTVIQLEAGRGDPKLSTLRKLAKALNVKVADLIAQ